MWYLALLDAEGKLGFHKDPTLIPASRMCGSLVFNVVAVILSADSGRWRAEVIQVI